MRKIFLAIAFTLAVVAAGVWYFTADTNKSNTVPIAEPAVTTGKPAPESVSKDLDANPASVRQSGKESVQNTAEPGKTNPVPIAEPGVTVGKLAPEFSLKDLNGNLVSIGRAGKVTVINFWATWCPPCRQEMPELEQFSLSSTTGMVFYAVNIQEQAAKVVGFLNQNKYTMPVLLDSDGTVANTFRINAIPTTIIMDKAGIVRFRKTGGVTKTELENVIKGF